MDLYKKISILGPDARYDTCGPKDLGKTTQVPGVYHAKVAGNHVCRLFKVLQSNNCSNNCAYCACRCDRAFQRAEATPDEMAKAFDLVYTRRLVDGLFLSSGIIENADQTMGKMLDTVSILRRKYQYRGYVHLKIMPGSSTAVIEQATKLANRISLNIEAPTDHDLRRLAPQKNLKTGFFKTILLIKNQLQKMQQQNIRYIPSLTTQFIVGAGKENDENIIRMTHLLYSSFDFKRVFYSAFRPISDTPLAGKSAESLTREHRLYQTDFLMRFYKFLPSDIPLDENGKLIETADPKLIWAKKNPDLFPVNLNTAGYWKLLKVPGIGPRSAKKIIKLRKISKIKSIDQLANKRLLVKKITQFVCC